MQFKQLIHPYTRTAWKKEHLLPNCCRWESPSAVICLILLNLWSMDEQEMLLWKARSSTLRSLQTLGTWLLGPTQFPGVNTEDKRKKKKRTDPRATSPRVSLICSEELWADLLNKGHPVLSIEQHSNYGMEKEWGNFVLIIFFTGVS